MWTVSEAAASATDPPDLGPRHAALAALELDRASGAAASGRDPVAAETLLEWTRDKAGIEAGPPVFFGAAQYRAGEAEVRPSEARLTVRNRRARAARVRATLTGRHGPGLELGSGVVEVPAGGEADVLLRLDTPVRGVDPPGSWCCWLLLTAAVSPEGTAAMVRTGVAVVARAVSGVVEDADAPRAGLTTESAEFFPDSVRHGFLGTASIIEGSAPRPAPGGAVVSDALPPALAGWFSREVDATFEAAVAPLARERRQQSYTLTAAAAARRAARESRANLLLRERLERAAPRPGEGPRAHHRHTLALLRSEALRAADAVATFDRYGAALAPCNRRTRPDPLSRLFWLGCPGAGDARPPLRVGSSVVRLRPHGVSGRSLLAYEARCPVWTVEQRRVLLAVPERLVQLCAPRGLVDARFPSEDAAWLSALASELDTAGPAPLAPYTFPPPPPPSPPPSFAADASDGGDAAAGPLPDDWRAFQPRCNPEQVAAVRRILAMEEGGAPHVVHGPAGTGKTMTVVEAVLQAVSRLGASVLVVTPSVGSADVVALRLAEFCGRAGETSMVRVCEPTRHEQLPARLLPHVLGDNAFPEMYRLPSAAEVRDASVVVCTSRSAVLLRRSLPRRETPRRAPLFDFVFADESSQSLEAELMAAVLLAVCGGAAASAGAAGTRLVLAGDHRQLGPRLHCPVARAMGLGVSLQERLSLRVPGYADLHPARASMLTRNYRSHPAILELPSRLFYSGRLVAEADKALTHGMLGWEGLPNPEVPLLFVGVEGEDVYEPESRSFSNPEEAAAVVDLVSSVPGRVPAADVAVVCPHQQQVLLVRRLLRAKGLGAVPVGTVGAFQGREYAVVVVSTVVSARGRRGIDDPDLFGVVGNPKQFNVAVTRAKALTAVVGSPAALREDPTWRRMLVHCARLGAYRGAPLPPGTLAAAGGGSDDTDHGGRPLSTFPL